MKYYFFINPIAGTGKEANGLVKKITGFFSDQDNKYDQYEIIMTRGVGDALEQSKDRAKALNGEEARFFACGGDGTMNEVFNGAHGFDNISVGVIPIGSGNDLVRNFASPGDFMDLEAQINGHTIDMDLIKYFGNINGEEKTGYCANMINIGFDCNVVETTNRLKTKPLISGSFAYMLAVFSNFVRKNGIALKITELDRGPDRVVRDDEMLLCAICNGSYCGGGIKSAPMSSVQDGIFELNIINNVTRREFLGIFPKFQRGEHMEIPGIDRVIDVRRCKDALIEPHNAKEFFICVDGEIWITTGIRVTMEHEAIKFIVPELR